MWGIWIYKTIFYRSLSPTLKNSYDHMKMWLPTVLYYTYLCGVQPLG